MPFNVVTGVYAPPAGAENALTGQVIQSAIWNTIHVDLAAALTLVEQQVQATYGQRNVIGSNGGMEVWQRGAGGAASIALSASTTAYTVDRWYLATGANQACNVTQVAGLNAPTGTPGSRWAAKIQRNNGQAGVTTLQFGFPLDSDECALLQNQIVALSFVAKAGANWSPASGALTVALLTGTGSPAKNVSGYSGQGAPIDSVINLTTVATRYTFVSSIILSTTTQAEVTFEWTPVGTAGVDDSFTIDDVQVEIFPVITGLPNSASAIAEFERWPFDRMLSACMRHFQKSFTYGSSPAQNAGVNTSETMFMAGKAGALAEFGYVLLRTQLRGAPNVTLYNPAASNAQVRDETASADCSSAAIANGNGNGFQVTATGASGTAVGNVLGVHWTADAGI